jgi:zinc transport system ATP-binding protein
MNALEVRDLSVRYGETVAALDHVSLSVKEGERVAIIGPNGGGKSTLLKAILGLCPIEGGTILIYGKPYDPRSRLVGYVPQYGTMERTFPISVTEVVESGSDRSGLHPLRGRASYAAAQDYLGKVGLASVRNRLVGELSGGQFQRLLIARSLAIQPKMLLLDEPTSSVDPESRTHIYRLLDALHEKGMTIILVTHDVDGIEGKMDRFFRLDGRILDG